MSFNGSQHPGERLEILDPIRLQDKPVPPRRWIVEGWVPHGNVTMLAGDGGVGKTLVALQLAVAAALGRAWLGQATQACKSLAVLCEDDPEEIHRRLADLAHHYGAELGDLENLQVVSRVGGFANLLMEFDGPWGKGEETGLYVAISRYAEKFGAQLVILDSLHDVFGGNENARPQARQFINALRTMAIEIDGAVILTAHPSLSGRNTGTGEAGSTAWNNAVRSRLYLRRPDDEEDGQDNNDRRILTTMKANYSRIGTTLDLSWKAGAFVNDEPEQHGLFGSIARDKAEGAFLDALAKLETRKANVSASPSANNYAPTVMVREGLAGRHRKRDLAKAMQRLFEDGTIATQPYGRPSDQRYKITIARPGP